MIERTSDVVSRDRRRLASLRHRRLVRRPGRQAHELRTPHGDPPAGGPPEGSLGPGGLRDAAGRSVAEVAAEVQRLDSSSGSSPRSRSCPRPTAESRMPATRPRLRRPSPTPGRGWRSGCGCPDLSGRVRSRHDRQVLVNLCDNSSRALAGRSGRHSPCGPRRLGLVGHRGRGRRPRPAPEVRGRLFDPYVTTAALGQGMGLGLASPARSC
jgi:hypothetical protein